MEKGEKLYARAGKIQSWAWVQLGIIYLGGHGVERDLAKSRELMQKGNDDYITDGDNSFEGVLARAEAGGKSAMYRTGIRYLYGGDDGKTYPVDPEKALYWLEKAADQGNWMSSILVSYEYYVGVVVPRDLEKARDELGYYGEDSFIMLREDIEQALAEEGNI